MNEAEFLNEEDLFKQAIRRFIEKCNEYEIDSDARIEELVYFETLKDGAS